MNTVETAVQPIPIGDAYEQGITHIRCINKIDEPQASCTGVATLGPAREGAKVVPPVQVQPGTPHPRTIVTNFRVDCPRCGGKTHRNYDRQNRPVYVVPVDADPAGPKDYRPVPVSM
jgi:hypothetical protein